MPNKPQIYGGNVTLRRQHVLGGRDYFSSFYVTGQNLNAVLPLAAGGRTVIAITPRGDSRFTATETRCLNQNSVLFILARCDYEGSGGGRNELSYVDITITNEDGLAMDNPARLPCVYIDDLGADVGEPIGDLKKRK